MNRTCSRVLAIPRYPRGGIPKKSSGRCLFITKFAAERKEQLVFCHLRPTVQLYTLPDSQSSNPWKIKNGQGVPLPACSPQAIFPRRRRPHAFTSFARSSYNPLPGDISRHIDEQDPSSISNPMLPFCRQKPNITIISSTTLLRACPMCITHPTYSCPTTTEEKYFQIPKPGNCNQRSVNSCPH